VNRLVGVLGVLLLLVSVLSFASLNGAERVTLRLGFVTFYRFPLTGVAFGGLLIGMVIMFIAGIQADLRVRRILRERLQAEAREERDPGPALDLAQRDLFEGGG
jgi:uncharacterized integral membrane protein